MKLLSPQRRRRCVVALPALFLVSDRFACSVVGQHPSTQRDGGHVFDIDDANLWRRLREFAAEYIRWGRPMFYRLLTREGWENNHKRVHRLWREEVLKGLTTRKQKRACPTDNSVRRH